VSLMLDKSGWARVSLGAVATASKEKVDPADGTVDRYVAGEHMDSDDLKIRRWGDPSETELGPAFHRRFHPGQILYG
jgi:type I restriction enzyme S subunit